MLRSDKIFLTCFIALLIILVGAVGYYSIQDRNWRRKNGIERTGESRKGDICWGYNRKGKFVLWKMGGEVIYKEN